ncbi:hypothetical protein ACGK9R_12055 [Halomonas sp. HNIBRBA4712]|uniref:hypothetical protein n=1 Tax=Halomonas sp. HNIBRBA4712 TaxID=3373087 RepID=UPI003747313F
MKKLTATAAIALALVSGSAFAERGAAALNSVDMPSTSVAQIESANASVEQLIAKNSGAGLPITHATSNANGQQSGDQAMSLAKLQARNGSTGEQTINADLDMGVASVKQNHDSTLSKDLLQARNGATGEQTIDAAQHTL